MRFSHLSGLILVGIVGLVAAFTSPNGKPYGVTADGTYWISSALVNGADGSNPKLMTAADNFARHAMVLDGDCYTVKAKVPLLGMAVDFCIDIGGNRYIPHALQAVTDQEILARVNPNDILDNGVGGYNFHVKPFQSAAAQAATEAVAPPAKPTVVKTTVVKTTTVKASAAKPAAAKTEAAKPAAK